MAVSSANVKAVFDKLTAANLIGTGPPTVPWGDAPTLDKVKRALERDVDALPFVYRRVYVDELREQLPAVIRQLNTADNRFLIETLVGAVYDHGEDDVAAPLGRFLAVVSNLYRSFLDAETRTKVDLPLIENVPPLAMFQRSGGHGPFTLPADGVQSLIGSTTGVVSMPSACRDHPFTWGSLAHETGGHDVLHADPGLIDELSAGVRQFFGADGRIDPLRPTGAQILGLLWAWWMDETASDVYGLLNMGPAFAMNLTVFLAAFIATFQHTKEPLLRAETGRDPNDVMDVHPVDLIRPHVAIGAIQALTGLDATTKSDYVTTLETMADDCSGGATEIGLVGQLPFGDNRALPLRHRVPIADMQDAARRVGSFIVSTRLRTLGGHSIQDLETWDDADEAVATRIAKTFALDASAVGIGDDAQLLAGATRAILDDPAKYDQVTKRLNDALDHSFAVDPLWGTPQPDLLWMPVRPIDADHFLDRDPIEIELVGREAELIAAAA